jgi:DNA polymerase I
MKLGDLFGKPKTLAGSVKKPTTLAAAVASSTAAAPVAPPKRKPGDFGVVWPKIPVQKVKEYKPILTLDELVEYLRRCQETGIAGFDYETAGDDDHRVPPPDPETGEPMDAKALNKWLLNVNLDPWKADICTMSIAAGPHESRVIPISHKAGKVFEPHLTRDKARKLVLDTVERMVFMNPKVIKIAANLAFETKHTAKHGIYIMNPVADPLTMAVRCMQLAAPQKIKDPKKPMDGWGLKQLVKAYLGVEMSSFKSVLAKYGATFFDEIPADSGEGLLYSAEDADYAVQLYLYWVEVAKQLENYYDWLHKIEMPFARVIGLMEYWGMAWDTDLARVKREEAESMQQREAEAIRQLAKDNFGLDLNVGKSGKTGDVRSFVFDTLKLPAAKWGKEKNGVRSASLDEEALIDMTFMLENNLLSLDEEKYLAVELPPDWEKRDPDTDPFLSKEERGAIRIRQRQPHPYKEIGLQLIQHLMKIQKYSTLLSSHIIGREKYLNSVSGRIHANYTPWTETARLNSNSPNGQNVPRPANDEFGIRNFYVPAPGKVLFLIDFAGFELRILAHYSGDVVMIDIFQNGKDMHAITAAEATGKTPDTVTKKERTDAKPVNFGIAYGGTEHSLQTTFKTEYRIRKSLDECKRLVDAVKRAYAGVPAFQRKIALEAREKGWVQAIYGYIRMLPHINSPSEYERGKAERQAANTPIQGSAAEIMKRAQNEVYDRIGLDTFYRKGEEQQQLAAEYFGLPDDYQPILEHGKTDMVAQIHDEMIFEMEDDPDVIEPAYRWIKATMEKPPVEGFKVPILAEASIAYRWGEKQDAEEWLEKRRAV